MDKYFRFPVPLSIEVIQCRLENNYYRSEEAVRHDIAVMLSNAESYFGKNSDLSMKIRRLSEWFDQVLLSVKGSSPSPSPSVFPESWRQ